MKNKKKYCEQSDPETFSRELKGLKMRDSIMMLIILFSMGFLISPRMAYAYLDPGTGSLMIQVIIAAFIGASFAIKMGWKKIKVFFTTHFSKKKKDENNDRTSDSLNRQ